MDTNFALAILCFLVSGYCLGGPVCKLVLDIYDKIRRKIG